MKQVPDEVVRETLHGFRIDGELTDVQPYRRGHIHDTFISTWRDDGHQRRFLHQRINDEVFEDVPALMHNIRSVTRHLRAKSEQPGEHAFDLETLRLVPARDGGVFVKTPFGPWRTYHYVEDTATYDLCAGADQAFEAARAFGWFQAQLTDLDPHELRQTIPQFFSSPHRMRQLDDVVARDPASRASSSSREIAFAFERRSMIDVVEDKLRAGAWPRRVVHGDTKLNNILFDRRTGRARCIVDLDTCMPAYSLYDFGDLVRFTAATGSEDELDLERVEMDPELYRALAAGYRASAGAFLTPDEVAHMPFAARLVTLTIGLRFLADHLAGDRYFKITREGHNLDRARVQFKLLESMERQDGV